MLPLRTLGLLYLIYGGYQTAIGVMLGLMFGAMSVILGIVAIAEGDEDAILATVILLFFSVFISGIVALTAVPKLVAGWGLRKEAPWGRVVALVAAVLSMLSFPIGTILAVVTFVSVSNAPATAPQP